MQISLTCLFTLTKLCCLTNGIDPGTMRKIKTPPWSTKCQRFADTDNEFGVAAILEALAILLLFL